MATDKVQDSKEDIALRGIKAGLEAGSGWKAEHTKLAVKAIVGNKLSENEVDVLIDFANISAMAQSLEKAGIVKRDSKAGAGKFAGLAAKLKA